MCHQQLLPKLNKTIQSSIERCSGGLSEEVEENCGKAVIQSLERKYPDAFLDVVHECGYTTQQKKKMTAELWTAMVEEAGLRVNQSRVMNSYLSQHFGSRVCVPEHQLAALTSRFVEFTMRTILFDKKKFYTVGRTYLWLSSSMRIRLWVMQ